MRILCLSGWFPYPPDNGARIRLFHLLRELSNHNYIDLLCFFREGEEYPSQDVLPPSCRLIGSIPFREFSSLSPRSLLGFFSFKPRALHSTFSKEMASSVKRTLEESKYDIVLAFEIGPGILTSPYIVNESSVPRVVEDLELSMIQSTFEVQRTPWSKFRNQLTWLKAKHYAVKLLAQVDGCTIASEREKALILEMLPKCMPLEVIPNGIALEHYSFDPGSFEDQTLIFPGAMTYQANYEAMLFFLKEIFPQIIEHNRNVQLFITGRYDGVAIERLNLNDNVFLTGYLDDVRLRIARSHVCVVPITQGGGTRLKILESMALGTPVISTSKGAEGLAVEHEENILIADEPGAFASAVLNLINDRRLRNMLSKNGKQLVRERYDWRNIGASLNSFLETILAGDNVR